LLIAGVGFFIHRPKLLNRFSIGFVGDFETNRFNLIENLKPKKLILEKKRYQLKKYVWDVRNAEIGSIFNLTRGT